MQRGKNGTARHYNANFGVIYLLCKSYHGKRKIMQKNTKKEKKTCIYMYIQIHHLSGLESAYTETSFTDWIMWRWYSEKWPANSPYVAMSTLICVENELMTILLAANTLPQTVTGRQPYLLASPPTSGPNTPYTYTSIQLAWHSGRRERGGGKGGIRPGRHYAGGGIWRGKNMEFWNFTPQLSVLFTSNAIVVTIRP